LEPVTSIVSPVIDPMIGLLIIVSLKTGHQEWTGHRDGKHCVQWSGAPRHGHLQDRWQRRRSGPIRRPGWTVASSR